MADVKVCDRCGKRLTDERMSFNLKPVTTRFILNATLFKKPRYSWEKIPGIINTEHDLCIDCATDLAEWMERGPTHGCTMEATTHD